MSKKAEPSQDEQGSRLFKEAIDTLEAGLFDDSVPIFESVIKSLGETHHLSILSYKSLVTISSNRGDFAKSLDWSLLLLEAQGRTLGYSHADTTKTVNNICTMCITLGKKDIAEEVKQLAKHASDKEKSKRSKQVRELRARNPLEDAEETTTEVIEKNPSVGQALGMVSRSMQDVGSIVAVGFVLLLVAAIFGPLAAFKYSYTESTLPSTLDSKSTFVSTDGTTKINFPSGTEVELAAGDKTLKRTCRFYGTDFRELGDLLLCQLPCNEYILIATRDKLMEGSRTRLYKTDSAEMTVIKQRNKIIDLASDYYSKNELYPDTLEELGDAGYDNPFTLRKDYPLIQNISIPAQSNFEQLFSSLAEGRKWEGEAALYPGALNCGHVSSKFTSSAADSFVIHACDGDGRLFRRDKGPSVVFLQRGRRIDPQPTYVPPRDAEIRVVTANEGQEDLLLILLRTRLLVFYSFVFLIFLVVGLKLNNNKGKYLSIGVALISLAVGLFATFSQI